jgi:hypothetical protein
MTAYGPMTAASISARRVAVLIDADNVGPAVFDAVMTSARQRGTVVLARAYGNWNDGLPAKWRSAFDQYNIEDVGHAPGRNATDIALAMDAVDLLYANDLHAVCVVSSDRDFAPLAERLKRSKVTAVLMADPAKVRRRHRQPWNTFVPLPAPKKAQASHSLVVAIEDILEVARKDSDGWARLSGVGADLAAATKKIGVGERKRSLLRQVAQMPALEVKERPFDGKGTATLCIRVRPAPVAT